MSVPARLAAAWAGDVGYNFRRSPVAVASAAVLAICLGAALFAPWVAPHNPFDLRTLDTIERITGLRPVPYLALEDEFENAVPRRTHIFSV